ncbi:DUF4215 domain-containing protein [Candidatus Nomurabacteria bacterium]|nr:DUF4215 domain-containing protein [Candidatus Nomurabacteria bacterium]
MKRLTVLVLVGIVLIVSSSIILDRSQDQLAILYQSRPIGQGAVSPEPLQRPLSACGNGIVQPASGEQCDDGNTNNTDGCSNTCQATFGAKTVLTSSNAGEVSGAEWHDRSNSFWIVDDGGKMVQIASNGSILGRWGNLGDIEGLAVADPASDFVYVGRENPPSIFKWNTQTHLPNDLNTPGTFWPLTDLQTCTGGNGGTDGLEALTFVENDGTGDIFYAGSQCNGRVYKYRINQGTGTIQNLGMIAGKPSNSNDLASLYFDPQYQVLYWVYDDINKLYATRKNSSSILASWNFDTGITPDQQESFSIRNGKAYLGTDNGTAGAGIFYEVPFAGLRY